MALANALAIKSDETFFIVSCSTSISTFASKLFACMKRRRGVDTTSSLLSYFDSMTTCCLCFAEFFLTFSNFQKEQSTLSTAGGRVTVRRVLTTPRRSATASSISCTRWSIQREIREIRTRKMDSFIRGVA